MYMFCPFSRYTIHYKQDNETSGYCHFSFLNPLHTLLQQTPFFHFKTQYFYPFPVAGTSWLSPSEPSNSGFAVCTNKADKLNQLC